MTIPIVKFDSTLPELDGFFDGPQRLTEGWVTINGHHILIGDDNKERMVGAADAKKEFTRKLSSKQAIAAQQIENEFQQAWHGEELPSVIKNASKELAAAGLNPKVAAAIPLKQLELNDTRVEKEAGPNAGAFYDRATEEIVLKTTVANPVVIHEFAHHLDNKWAETWQTWGSTKLAEMFGQKPDNIQAAFNNTAKEIGAAKGKVDAILKVAEAAGETDELSTATSAKLDNVVISRYAYQGGIHEWLAEGVRQYTASPSARRALATQFPATFNLAKSMLTGEFKEASAEDLATIAKRKDM